MNAPHKDSPADTGVSEIEVTPEMIEAGNAEISRRFLGVIADLEAGALAPADLAAVFSEMDRVRQRPSR